MVTLRAQLSLMNRETMIVGARSLCGVWVCREEILVKLKGNTAARHVNWSQIVTSSSSHLIEVYSPKFAIGSRYPMSQRLTLCSRSQFATSSY